MIEYTGHYYSMANGDMFQSNSISMSAAILNTDLGDILLSTNDVLSYTFTASTKVYSATVLIFN
jgi:hypothetical protein